MWGFGFYSASQAVRWTRIHSFIFHLLMDWYKWIFCSFCVFHASRFKYALFCFEFSTIFAIKMTVITKSFDFDFSSTLACSTAHGTPRCRGTIDQRGSAARWPAASQRESSASASLLKAPDKSLPLAPRPRHKQTRKQRKNKRVFWAGLMDPALRRPRARLMMSIMEAARAQECT